ncbi:MAG: hypothetical protein FD153_1696 [Rhodospirillaceae bacterium]|nr:MAG: hypothetical protein FD153_1696 [Rhodospirillaceae bacterium]
MTSLAIFEPLYFSDRLYIINPHGDVGIATLWTPVRQVVDFLARYGIDLDPASSRIAVLGTLYGDGLPQLIRNLLWNPQIHHILILGQNLSGSAEELANLLTLGVEQAERLNQPRFRIRGTTRCLDTAFDPALLTDQVRPVSLGKLSAPETARGLQIFFATLPPPELPRRDRVQVPLPEYRPVYFPSEPRAHTIVRRKPLDAWEEVVTRVLRFGVPVVAGEGKPRLELQNLKVIVTEPVADAEADLRAVGFLLADFQAYQTAILSDIRPEGVDYTYGHRLRRYWGLDLLEAAATRLKANPGSRGGFLTVWDPATDLVADATVGTPCLTTLFFRVFQEVLTLTATFRVHNVMSAWLRNLYGLMALQAEVGRVAGGLPVGAITVISHAIAIDPDTPERLDLARQIAAAKISDGEIDRATGKRTLREDPNGYFIFTVDQAAEGIVAVHKTRDGETLTQYRGRTAMDVERQIVHDGAISDIGHALYVGRQLAILEERVKREKTKTC